MKNSRAIALISLLLLCGLGPTVMAQALPELSVAGPVLTPINHQKYFRGERELFGYAPLFNPNPISFDLANVPYIRTGIDPLGHNEDGGSGGSPCTMGVIQTLDNQGNWIQLNTYIPAIRAKYPAWDGTYREGDSQEQRIVFDSSGDAYMIVATIYAAGINSDLLLHSKDRCRTWTVYPIPGYYHRLEVKDTNNEMDLPPAILSWNGYSGTGNLLVIIPSKKADGTLDHTGDAIFITSSFLNWGAPAAEGLFNCVVTKNNLTHIVYMGGTVPEPGNGTPEYIATVNRTTRQKVAGPIYLGYSGLLTPGSGDQDNHNSPTLTIDSQGYLHVVFGAHHYYFKYTKSNVPNSITGGWSIPVQIDTSHNSGWTYASLVCDKNDTLHLIGRYSGNGYMFELHYLRKKTTDPIWVDLGTLVHPFRYYYSNWYQLPAVDRRGRVFLNYMYYADQLDYDPTLQGESAAYKAKWPWDGIYPLTSDNSSWANLHAHDPAMIMTDNGGDTWRLALTPSLQVFFNNGFEAGMDGWDLYKASGSDTPIATVSSYIYNGHTITPRSGSYFARAASSYYSKMATRIIDPPQSGMFTGCINLLDNATYTGMFEIYVPGHSVVIMTNPSDNPGKVSYRIDSTVTATGIPATPLVWHQVRAVAVASGLSVYWDGSPLFQSSPIGTALSRIVFGSEWSTAPAGYDDFSFTPVNGDANGDSQVNAADLSMVLAGMDGTTGGPADIDGDGVVTGTDLAIVLANMSN